jgi:N,N'-diacetyllegionaminate synthase
MAEVYRSLETVGALDGRPTVLLLCTSQYPTPPADVNLRKLATLQAAFPMVPLGFSDHTIGPLASSLAAALGACVFEKHFTMDKNLPGPDHWFSENPAELATWITSIRTAKTMLGQAVVRPTIVEQTNKKEFQRVIVAACDISPGEILSDKHLTMRRVPGGRGLPPSWYELLLGTSATRAYSAGQAISL